MSLALEFWQTLTGCLEAGERVFLTLVAENTRHSPGTAGARMMLSESGRRSGTIGGGIMEYKLLERAVKILDDVNLGSSFAPEIQTLHHRKTAAGERSGMICAGSQTNLYYLCRPESELDTVRQIVSRLRAGSSGILSITRQGMAIEDDEGDQPRPSITLERKGEEHWHFTEQLLNRRRLAIFGGGHCALALARTMSRLDYEILVFETREDVFDEELRRFARTLKIVDDFRHAGERVAYPELTFAVVMTTDFPSDVKALSGVLPRPFRFIGVMGAPAKLRQIKSHLEDQGFSSTDLDRIHAPVGLPIPSHTPDEIAISVAAQILELRAER